MKKCTKCNILKHLKYYYKDKGASSGYSSACKECKKEYQRNRNSELYENLDYIEDERKRGRDKYRRLYDSGRKIFHTSSNKQDYYNKYPEKIKAHGLCFKLRKHSKGNNLHHWSYNQSDATDVIELSIKDHFKAHRFIIYDQERYMYRRYDTMELLDTKEKHFEFIMWCIQNKED